MNTKLRKQIREELGCMILERILIVCCLSLAWLIWYSFWVVYSFPTGDVFGAIRLFALGGSGLFGVFMSLSLIIHGLEGVE